MINRMTHSENSPNQARTVSERLAEAARLGFEIVVTTPDHCQIPNGRLAIDHHNPDLLELQIPQQFTLASDTAIDCLFTTMQECYCFKSRVMAQAGMDKKCRSFKILFPETIEQKNRRLYNRAKSSLDQPVWLHFQHTQKGPVRVLVEDISVGGACIVMPEKLYTEDIQNPLPCKVCLPSDTCFNVKITPCNLRRIFGMVKIGVKIVSIEEEDRHRIAEYVNSRVNECEIPEEKNRQNDVRLAVIEPPINKSLSPLLKDRYTINRAWQAGNLAKLSAYLPDLIVVDMNHPEALSCLNSIKNSPALCVRPLVVVGKMQRGIMSFGASVRYLSQPAQQQHLEQAIDQLIDAYRLSQHILTLPSRCWQTTTVAIFRSPHKRKDESVEVHLRRSNCRVVVIEDPKRLVSQLAQTAPQCILLESDDQAETDTICRILAFNKSLKKTPKILLTRNRMMGQQLCETEQVVGFIEKPLSEKVLISAVYAAIDDETS